MTGKNVVTFQKSSSFYVFQLKLGKNMSLKTKTSQLYLGNEPKVI